MMLSFEPQHGCVLCFSTATDQVNTLNLIGDLTYASDGILMFKLPFSMINVFMNSTSNGDYYVESYLDRFYLIIPKNSPVEHQHLIDAFFSIIADSYDQLIDIHRNVENITILIDYIHRFVDLSEDSIVYDFGCGTGLSVHIAIEMRMNIIGIERCRAMRQIALSRGMNVIGPEDLSLVLECSIDAAFASYVFHLLSDASYLDSLWRCIKPAGVLVANFHKNRGSEAIMRFMQDKNAKVVNLGFPNGIERHGRHVAYIKP